MGPPVATENFESSLDARSLISRRNQWSGINGLPRVSPFYLSIDAELAVTILFSTIVIPRLLIIVTTVTLDFLERRDREKEGERQRENERERENE